MQGGSFRLLNHAARYFPILRELLPQLPPGARVLEIGSGSRGLGEFWPGPFVGCDVNFPNKPRKPMLPVMCSGDRLPFADSSFDAVVCSDVLEHVPPQKRWDVVVEALRVTRGIAVFGFPHGPAAFELDRGLHLDYTKRGMTPPVWLDEHMQNAFPTSDLFRELPTGWKMKAIPNESLPFHQWVMRMEMNRWRDHFFRVVLRIAPTIFEWLLRRADREPSYRMIFVLTRDVSPAGI